MVFLVLDDNSLLHFSLMKNSFYHANVKFFTVIDNVVFSSDGALFAKQASLFKSPNYFVAKLALHLSNGIIHGMARKKCSSGVIFTIKIEASVLYCIIQLLTFDIICFFASLLVSTMFVWFGLVGFILYLKGILLKYGLSLVDEYS